MIYMIVSMLLITFFLTVIFNKKIIRWFANKKGRESLEKLLFVNGMDCKRHVIKTLMEITSNRLTDDEALDYFLKIKGLQVVDLNAPVGFWTRKYLMSTPRVRLSYFEQVKFYESFLNFSTAKCREASNHESLSLSTFPLTEATQELIRNPILSKNLAFTGE